MVEDQGTPQEAQTEVFHVRVEEARLQRDENGSKVATLVWRLRIIKGGTGLIWHRQLFAPENLNEIRKNVALCGIFCSNKALPSQLVKAAGCELEIQREDTQVTFTKRLDKGVFTGTIEGQQVAEEIPL